MADDRNRTPRVTLRFLAAELGVSPATVLRALNNHPNVTQGIRRRVIAAAMKYNYQLPEHNARVIAVIVPDASNFDGYTGQLLNALSLEFSTRKLAFEIIVNKDLEAIHEHAYSGVISTVWEQGLEKSWPQEHTLPLIVLNAPSNIAEGICQVSSDEHQGIFRGLEHLFCKGKKRIAFVSTPLANNPNAQERVRAFAEFCRTHQLDECFHEEHSIENSLEMIAGNIAAKRADAVFACSETYGFQLLHCFRQLDLRVPEDIGMVSLEMPLFSPYTFPPLTTVGQNFPQLAFHAVELLIKRMEKQHCPGKISVPYIFYERQSV